MRRRRRRIFWFLCATWGAVTLGDITFDIPPAFTALAWIAIFLLSAGVSLAMLPAAYRYRRIVKTHPGLDLRRVLAADAYIRRELGRLITASAFVLIGLAALVQWDAPIVSLFFMGGLAILGNSLYDREDRYDHARLNQAEIEQLDKEAQDV